MSSVLISGGRLVRGDGLERTDIWVENGRIRRINAHISRPNADVRRIDATDHLIAPGFIDLQINGAFGHDFTHDPGSMWPVAAQLPRYGVTAFLPTIITSPPETVAAAQQALAAPPDGFAGARPLGLHLEGPFFSPDYHGAHDSGLLRDPSPTTVETWTAANGVRLVTLAPERPGAAETIAALRAQGVIVSAGHSAADYEHARAALQTGVGYGTHLFNAMPPLHHRRPGLAAALLDDDTAVVGLIADGVHVHPAQVRLAARLLGRRLNLVTDAMAALGLPPGESRLGHRPVTVTDTAVRLPDGTLAGSVLALDQAVRNLIAFTGCDIPTAVRSVTATPADLLGMGDEIGRLQPGLRADIVLLDADLQPTMTLIGGKMAKRGSGEAGKR